MSWDIILNLNSSIYLILEAIISIFQLFIFIFSIILLKNWNHNATTQYQYNLEQKTYLVTVTLYFTLIVKIILFGYFGSVLDQLSQIVPGAMCGAGVINSNIYGEPLLLTKTIILFGSFCWIIINKLDLEKKHLPYIKPKYRFYILLFLLFIVEIYLDIQFFINISTTSLVSCCSVIYTDSNNSNSIYNISIRYLLVIFYTIFILIIFVNYKKLKTLSSLLNLIFLYISYYMIVLYFSCYIYQLPTHHCPFCILQKDYFYIGYIIFISLFLGTFFGMVNQILYFVTKQTNNIYFNFSTIFNTIFVAINTSFVIIYYLKNGVFL